MSSIDAKITRHFTIDCPSRKFVIPQLHCDAYLHRDRVISWTGTRKKLFGMVFSLRTCLGRVIQYDKIETDNSSIWQIDTTESSLLITEPYFNLPNLQDVYDQFVFEEYEFQSYHRCTRQLSEPDLMVLVTNGTVHCFSCISYAFWKYICQARLTHG